MTLHYCTNSQHFTLLYNTSVYHTVQYCTNSQHLSLLNNTSVYNAVHWCTITSVFHTVYYCIDSNQLYTLHTIALIHNTLYYFTTHWCNILCHEGIICFEVHDNFKIQKDTVQLPLAISNVWSLKASKAQSICNSYLNFRRQLQWKRPLQKPPKI